MCIRDSTNGGAGSQVWTASDLTAATKGPTVTGRPSPVVASGVIDVFARASTGILTEFSANGSGGDLWNSYGLTTSSGPTVADRPPNQSHSRISHEANRAFTPQVVMLKKW